MGNCNDCDQKNSTYTVTNFDEVKWNISETTIDPNCFILKNYHHHNVKLIKWISSYYKTNKISKWRS